MKLHLRSRGLVSAMLVYMSHECNQGTSSSDTAPCTLCSMCRAPPLGCKLDTCYAMLEFIVTVVVLLVVLMFHALVEFVVTLGW